MKNSTVSITIPRFFKFRARTAVCRALFPLLEPLGVHLTPVTFYSPIPTLRDMPDSVWLHRFNGPGVDLGPDKQVDLFATLTNKYAVAGDSLACPPAGELPFAFDNGMFGHVDAEMYYWLIRHFRPRRIIEVG